MISVAATNPSDRLYSWSNRGSWVTMAAPGCSYSGRPKAQVGLAVRNVPGVTARRRHGRADEEPRTQARPRAADPDAGLQHSTGARSVSHTVDWTRHGRCGLLHSRTPSQPTPRRQRRSRAPRPAPPRQGQYEWRGELGGDDHWDRKVYYIRGHVHVSVNWSGADEITVYVQHPNGRR